MTVGTVKWFNKMKGYGFIQPDDGSKDIFVHVTALEQSGMQTLAEGQRVNFELATNKGRTQATNVKPA